MAIPTLAAGLEFRVIDRATPGLRKVSQGLAITGKKARAANRSMFLAGAAASALGIGALAVGRGLFRAAGNVADFQQQISAVRAVLRKPSGAPELEREIKRLGATTVFTATESAKGAELLARAGFDQRESIAALGDTLNLAAADSLQLAAATSITTSTLKAFQLDANETGMVVDILAQTSSKSNTNVTQLGEALKFAAPFAKGMGVDLADTNIALGLLANMGLRGTVGGTALKNMFIKLAAPADKAKAAMKKAGFSMVKTSDGSLNLMATIKKLSGVFDKMKGPVDRVAFAQTVFGIRGGTAAINLAGAFKKMSSEVDGSTNKFDKFVSQIRDAEGAAKEMAEIRLKNLRGAFTLLLDDFHCLMD